MWEKHDTPPPHSLPPPPVWDTKSQNKGIEDIMDIDSNCPSLLFGETTSHLPSKWRGTFQYFFLNVENSIKREMRKNCFSTKKIHTPIPPPLRNYFLYTKYIFFNVGNSMKREENMKYWKNIFQFFFFQYLKNSNNILSISKTIQHTPMTWCTYLQSFEKIHQCVFELQCEN